MGIDIIIGLVIVWAAAVIVSALVGCITSSVFVGVLYFIYAASCAYAGTMLITGEVTLTFIAS